LASLHGYDRHTLLEDPTMAARTQPDTFLSAARNESPVIHSPDDFSEPSQPLLMLDVPSKFWTLLVSPLITGLFGAAVAFTISYSVMHTTVARLQERLDATEAQLRDKADGQRMQATVNDLRSDITTVRTQYAPLAPTLGDHGARITRDETDLGSLKSEVMTHARSQAQTEVKLQYLEKQLAELDRLKAEVNNIKLRLLNR
jgi:hypothetical protein